VALYAFMYGAFGVSSPFMPAFFERRGLVPAELGVLFGAGTAVRLISGPVCGRLADLTRSRRGVLAICAAIAALVGLSLLGVGGFSALFAVSVLHAAALAPITTLADALALGASAARAGGGTFEYGWVRGTGSGVFILGTLLSGQLVSAWGLGSILVLQAAQLAAAAGTAMLVPAPPPSSAGNDSIEPAPRDGWRGCCTSPRFRRVRARLQSRAWAATPCTTRSRSSAGVRAGVSPSVVSVLCVGGGRGRRSSSSSCSARRS
jgi:PPP family 3-phenylpropionic acid transporter